MLPDPTEIARIIKTALAEDIGQGDITSALLIPQGVEGHMALVAREALVVAGVEVAAQVFKMVGIPSLVGGARSSASRGWGLPLIQQNKNVPLPTSPLQGEEAPHITIPCKDKARVSAGTILMRIEGNARSLLTAERVALNLLQRMCGIATLTSRYVEAVSGTNAKILDTRKTMPGLRAIDKYAVICGGGLNHRMRLDDAVLIKDNHLFLCGSIAAAMEKVKQSNLPIIIECDTLAQVKEALAAKPDRILLDNMSIEMLREAVALSAGRISLEASGGVTLQTVRAIAETGVDYISVGALTHSAPAADIGADMEWA